MKSRAPRRIASTATSTVPQAVITTTGSDSSASVDALQQVEAFLARGGVARVVEVHQDHVEVLQLERAQDCGGDAAVSITKPSGFSSSRSASRTSAWSSAMRIRDGGSVLHRRSSRPSA